jgi:hypothetical protein
MAAAPQHGLCHIDSIVLLVTSARAASAATHRRISAAASEWTHYSVYAPPSETPEFTRGAASPRIRDDA